MPGLDVVATRHPRSVTDREEITGVQDAQGRHWVVRAPRDSAAGAALLAEGALLNALERYELPFAVAVPAGWSEIPEVGRAVVHRDLPGRPLQLHTLEPGPGLAASLGSALAALHELDPGIADEAGLTIFDAAQCRSRLLVELDELAGTGRVPAVLLRRWEEMLEDVAAWRFRPTLVHGELDSDCVLVDGERVTALTGFTAAHIGDPALDLAWLVAAAPEDALESVLEAYDMARTEGGAGHLVLRAQLMSELALGRWLLHGLRRSDETVVAEAAAMLADLADAVQGLDEA